VSNKEASYSCSAGRSWAPPLASLPSTMWLCILLLSQICVCVKRVSTLAILKPNHSRCFGTSKRHHKKRGTQTCIQVREVSWNRKMRRNNNSGNMLRFANRISQTLSKERCYTWENTISVVGSKCLNPTGTYHVTSKHTWTAIPEPGAWPLPQLAVLRPVLPAIHAQAPQSASTLWAPGKQAYVLCCFCLQCSCFVSKILNLQVHYERQAKRRVCFDAFVCSALALCLRSSICKYVMIARQTGVCGLMLLFAVLSFCV